MFLARHPTTWTAKGVLTPLSGMFSLAVEDGHISFNPATRILKRSRTEEGERKEEVQFLTREEVGVLLETCKEHFPSYFPLILLLVRTGLRIGEAFALQWDDIDFHGRFAEVQRTFSNGRVSTPKTNKSRRVDPSQQLTETLKAFLVERKKEALRKGWDEVPEWVFINEANGPLHRSNFSARVWLKLPSKAGLRSLRIHDLHHIYASLLIQNRESLASVKEQLGHHSIQITVDRLDEPGNATIRNPDATTANNPVLAVPRSARK